MTTTPDKQRVVMLQQDGWIYFFHPRYQLERSQLEMLKLHTDLPYPSDLAFDRAGRRMALVGGNGRIELWDTGEVEQGRQLPKSADETDRWSSTSLLEGANAVTRTRDRVIQIDNQGRLCALVVETNREDHRDDGALFFLLSDGAKVIREQLSNESAEFSRRMSRDSIDLRINARDEPIVLFRTRTADQGSYNGTMHLAKRTGRDAWSYSLLHQHGNMGFYPAMVLGPDGEVSNVLHYTFAGKYLLASGPGDESEWDVEPLGLQGDGFDLRYRQDDRGRLHALFEHLPFDGGQHERTYFQWDRQQGEVVREAFDGSGKIDLLPDGTPVALTQNAQSYALVRRTAEGWVEHQQLPMKQREL